MGTAEGRKGGCERCVEGVEPGLSWDAIRRRECTGLGIGLWVRRQESLTFLLSSLVDGMAYICCMETSVENLFLVLDGSRR